MRALPSFRALHRRAAPAAFRPRSTRVGIARCLPGAALALPRWLTWGGVLACALQVVTPAWAGPEGRAAGIDKPIKGDRAAELGADSLRDARSLLQRIQSSTLGRSFEGTFVVSDGKSMTSSRIVHVCDGHDQYERVEALGGPMRTIYRHNDLVQTMWPDSKRAVIEQRVTLRGFPALPVAVGEGVSQYYDLVSVGVDRVAGHEADVVLLKPRDGLRYAQRLWSERSTGLLLRADVLNERGQVVESAAFSELAIGPRKPTRTLAKRMNQLAGYEVVEARTESVSLDGEGWVLRAGVPGFSHVASVRRVGPEAEAGGKAGGQPIIQAIYADGLTHVSLFIEPYVAGQHGTEGVMSVGATQALMRRMGEWWITAVGDVPATTLRQFALGLERQRR